MKIRIQPHDSNSLSSVAAAKNPTSAFLSNLYVIDYIVYIFKSHTLSTLTPHSRANLLPISDFHFPYPLNAKNENYFSIDNRSLRMSKSLTEVRPPSPCAGNASAQP